MKNLTDITFVLDRSGSMASMVTDVIGGWKTFVAKQKAEVGDCTLSLVQFDTIYETVFAGVPIQNVSPSLDFMPRGGTALRDAIGRTINDVGARLRALPDKERPQNVIIAIMTDGEENSSHEFTQAQIKSMVEHQTNKYGWQFLFLGANIDAFLVGSQFGVAQGLTSGYSYNSGGLRGVFDTVSCYASASRTGEKFVGTLSACQVRNEAEQENILRNANTATVTLTGGTQMVTNGGTV